MIDKPIEDGGSHTYKSEDFSYQREFVSVDTIGFEIAVGDLVHRTVTGVCDIDRVIPVPKIMEDEMRPSHIFENDTTVFGRVLPHELIESFFGHFGAPSASRIAT